jgi:Ca-activated chloride channel family protein
VREAAEARPIPVNAPAGWAMTQRSTGAPPPMQAMYAVGGSVNANATRAGGYGPGGAPDLAKFRRMSPPMAGAPAPAPAFAPPPAPPASKGSVFSRAKDAIAGFFQGDDESVDGAMAEAAIPESLDIPSPEATSGDPAFSILSRQLASGLWDDGKGDTVGATRRALVELLKLGIDTAHPLHGELVRKAIEALVPLALSGKDSGALFVAYLAAVGKRTRKMVRDAVEKLGLGQALVAKLTDEAALRKEVLG